MAAAAAAGAAGLQVVGGIVGAMGAQQAGQAKATADKFNSQIQLQNAAVSLDQANADAAMQARAAKQIIGGARAAYGAAGVTGDGSVADVIGASATAAELDRQTILYHGRLQAMGYEQQSSLDLYAAQQAGIQADYQSASSLLQGVGAGSATAVNAKLFS